MGLLIQAFGVNIVTIKYPKIKDLVYCSCQVMLVLFLFFSQRTCSAIPRGIITNAQKVIIVQVLTSRVSIVSTAIYIKSYPTTGKG